MRTRAITEPAPSRTRPGRWLLPGTLLVIAAGIALFLLSPLAPHRTTAVATEVTGTSGAVQVTVSDRQGRRTAPLDEAASMPADLASPEPGGRIPVLTYRSGRVVYDDGSLLPTLWGATALITITGLALTARERRRRTPS